MRKKLTRRQIEEVVRAKLKQKLQDKKRSALAEQSRNPRKERSEMMKQQMADISARARPGNRDSISPDTGGMSAEVYGQDGEEQVSERRRTEDRLVGHPNAPNRKKVSEGSGDRNDPGRETGHGDQRQKPGSAGNPGVYLEEADDDETALGYRPAKRDQSVKDGESPDDESGLAEQYDPENDPRLARVQGRQDRRTGRAQRRQERRTDRHERRAAIQGARQQGRDTRGMNKAFEKSIRRNIAADPSHSADDQRAEQRHGRIQDLPDPSQWAPPAPETAPIPGWEPLRDRPRTPIGSPENPSRSSEINPDLHRSAEEALPPSTAEVQQESKTDKEWYDDRLFERLSRKWAK